MMFRISQGGTGSTPSGKRTCSSQVRALRWQHARASLISRNKWQGSMIDHYAVWYASHAPANPEQDARHDKEH